MKLLLKDSLHISENLSTQTADLRFFLFFVCLFGLLLYVPVNSCGQVLFFCFGLLLSVPVNSSGHVGTFDVERGVFSNKLNKQKSYFTMRRGTFASYV